MQFGREEAKALVELLNAAAKGKYSYHLDDQDLGTLHNFNGEIEILMHVKDPNNTRFGGGRSYNLDTLYYKHNGLISMLKELTEMTEQSNKIKEGK